MSSTLPSDWGHVRLGQQIEIVYGKGLPEHERVSQGLVPVYGSNGIVGQHIEAITNAPVLIIGRKGSAGAVHFSEVPCWPIDTAFYVDKFPPNLDAKYLGFFLQTQNLASLNIHSAIPGIRRDDLYGIVLPIPYPDDPARSLETQRRIVARIEALFAELREARRLHAEIVADTGRVMEAALREVFDQPADGWHSCQLIEVAFIQTGTAKGRNFRDRKTVELPYLRVANVQAGYLDLDEIKTIRIAESEINRYRLLPGDLLLTEGGDFDKLGRGAVWHGEIESCVHQNHIFAVRFDQDVVQPEFAEYEMLSWHAKRYFLGVAKKTTNLATINSSQLAAFPIKFPALPEQRRIVAYLDSVRQQATELQAIQKQNGTLLADMERSILAQAFRGEL